MNVAAAQGPASSTLRGVAGADSNGMEKRCADPNNPAQKLATKE